MTSIILVIYRHDHDIYSYILNILCSDIFPNINIAIFLCLCKSGRVIAYKSTKRPSWPLPENKGFSRTSIRSRLSYYYTTWKLSIGRFEVLPEASRGRWQVRFSREVRARNALPLLRLEKD